MRPSLREPPRIGYLVEPAGRDEGTDPSPPERRVRRLRHGARDPLAQAAHPARHPDGRGAGLDGEAAASGERDDCGRADADGGERHVELVDRTAGESVVARLQQRPGVADHRHLDGYVAGEQHLRRAAIRGIDRAGGAALGPGEQAGFPRDELPGRRQPLLGHRNPAFLGQFEQQPGPVQIPFADRRVELGGEPFRRQPFAKRPVEGEPGIGRRPVHERLREGVLREKREVRGRGQRGAQLERPPQQNPQLHRRTPATPARDYPIFREAVPCRP